MANGFITEDVKITFEAPTAAGTTTIDSAAYDQAGYNSILFVVRLGTPATDNNIRARQSTASAGTYADLTGTLVNHASNNTHMLDLKRPEKQFVRCRVTRGTSTTIDGIVVIQYNAHRLPVTQPTSVLEQWLAPVEGTA